MVQAYRPCTQEHQASAYNEERITSSFPSTYDEDVLRVVLFTTSISVSKRLFFAFDLKFLMCMVLSKYRTHEKTKIERIVYCWLIYFK